MLDKNLRDPVFAIYGFVRYADEIVDTFFDYSQKDLLEEFISDTYKAIDRGISTNPIIDSFQMVVNRYGIEKKHIDAFLESMRMDLYNHTYSNEMVQHYIYGSAEVVGLMCLRIFYHDDDRQYESMKYYARKLGEAFQKVNFLRDIQSDFNDRGRTYFQDIINNGFTEDVKLNIERDIETDFKEAYRGIKMLNKSSRFGVYLAYIYYKRLFRKIQRANPNTLMKDRIRIPNSHKIYLLFQAYVRNSMNII
jgi:15-cis-phytoene synthase